MGVSAGAARAKGKEREKNVWESGVMSRRVLEESERESRLHGSTCRDTGPQTEETGAQDKGNNARSRIQYNTNKVCSRLSRSVGFLSWMTREWFFVRKKEKKKCLARMFAATVKVFLPVSPNGHRRMRLDIQLALALGT